MVLGNRKKEINALREKLSDLQSAYDQLNASLAKSGFEDSKAFSPALLQQMIRMNGIGFWSKSEKSGVFWISDLAKDMVGLSKHDSITWDQFKNAFLPEDRQLFEKSVSELKPGDKSVELEAKISRAEGEGREFRIINMILSLHIPETEPENPVLLASMRDITRNEKLKKDLLRTKEKAEEAEKLKNTLLTNISHEIRTPMNAIIGFSELLNIGNIPVEKQFKYARIIKNQGLQLLKMIDDMVELTSVETGKITINKSPCNIDLLLNELLAIFSPYKTTLNKQHIEIKAILPEPHGMVVFTDPGRLQQIFAHLITNAIKFTEKGTIEVGYKVLPEQRIEFFVKDTGIGLSKDLQKNIFSRFTEEDLQGAKSESTGLGLAISRNLVRLLGGRIWVESELGKGSVFYFTVPYEEIPDTYHDLAVEEEKPIPSYTWKDKVILVVEDDEINFRFLEALLQSTSVQILRASNGIEAVALCKTINKIDLVLMDIKMPDMDGIEATRSIRSFNKKIPIIVQTAFVMEKDLDSCLEAGCNDHITKPIDIKEFMEKMDRYLKEK